MEQLEKNGSVYEGANSLEDLIICKNTKED